MLASLINGALTEIVFRLFANVEFIVFSEVSTFDSIEYTDKDGLFVIMLLQSLWKYVGLFIIMLLKSHRKLVDLFNVILL